MLCLAQLVLRIEPEAYGRATLYRAALVGGLALAAAPLALWLLSGRAPERFGLFGWTGQVAPALGFGLLWALLLGWAWRLAAAGRLRDPLLRVYRRLDYLMPRTRRELRAAWRASLVAASGEEIAFRGFLLWYGTLLLAPAAGLIGSTLLFAVAHAYQRRLGMAFAAGAGLLLGAAYLASGSLLLVIWMHASWNMFSFALGRRLMAAAGDDRIRPL